MKKWLFLVTLLLFLFSISNTYAQGNYSGDIHTLNINGTLKIEGRELILKNVGSTGNIIVDVSSVISSIKQGQIENINCLSIKNIDFFFTSEFEGRTATIGVGEDRDSCKMPIINKTLEEINRISTDEIIDGLPINQTLEEINITSTNEISQPNLQEKGCDGCLDGDECVPYGTRLVFDYCSQDQEFKPRKNFEESCTYDYECRNNSCLENQCKEKGFWINFFRWLDNLFGKD